MSLVYSTEAGRICPECRKPCSACICIKKKPSSKIPPGTHPHDGIVRIQRETKGRKGKTATLVCGLSLNEHDLKQLARKLKTLCGTGGSVKNGMIVIQGDHRQTLLNAIQQQGYTAKLAGG
ncbi:MAG: translation initiation factor Sui1 [Desulfobacterales bacterium]|nr:translation initiation factor Sui1 [Desulfobacterales bacterium]